MDYLSAGLIAEDDKEGIEKTLMGIVDCRGKFIISIIYTEHHQVFEKS